MTTELVSIGEGFAFFRFHVLRYPYSDCWGFRDMRPGMGYCMDGWRTLNRRPTDLGELIKLARFQILDRRNCNEAALERLLGRMADEIERLDADAANERAEAASWKAVAHDHSERLKRRDAEVQRLRIALNEHASREASSTQDTDHQLQRYGVKWQGPREPIAVPMDDGYWTPWHKAQEQIERFQILAADYGGQLTVAKTENTILTLPDGSAFDSRFVAAITWDKARGSGEYASPPCIRVFTAKSDFMMRSPQMEQTHYCPMESDAAAREACQMLVSGWTGKAAAPVPAEVQ